MQTHSLALIGVLALFLAACGGSSSTDTPVAPSDPVAANGWPLSKAPTQYQGTGHVVGQLIPDIVAGDQNGNGDVRLSQFYGAMVVLAFDAEWGTFSVIGAAEAEGMRQRLEAESSEYRVYWISALQALSGPASQTEAAAWTTTHGLSGPVLHGQSVNDLWTSVGTFSVPTYVILDPNFEIRTVLNGWVGVAAMETAVRDAWTAFRNDNTAWVSPFINN